MQSASVFYASPGKLAKYRRFAHRVMAKMSFFDCRVLIVKYNYSVMKVMFLNILMIFLVVAAFSSSTVVHTGENTELPDSQTGETVELPDPQMSGGMPLMDALSQRQSMRSFDTAELSSQQLSDLLWAAFGVSRPASGLRTAPSARNWQDIDIYVVMSKGWYIYNHEDHSLVRKGDEDLRSHTGSQDFVDKAPVNLVFVSDHTRMGGDVDQETRSFYASNHAGYISQNVYLYCASEGLATVVRGLIDRDKITEALELEDYQQVIFAQTVGYPGE